MNIKEITFKTNKNLGNMEHIAIELRADVHPEFEDVDACFEDLKNMALQFIETTAEELKPKQTNGNKRRR